MESFRLHYSALYIQSIDTLTGVTKLTYHQHSQLLRRDVRPSAVLPTVDVSFFSSVSALNAIFDDCHQNKKNC